MNLAKIGITTEEYATYKTLLENPAINVSDLAQAVGVTRVTMYKILAALKAKGLVSEVDNKQTGVRYMPASPEVLNRFVDESRQQTETEFAAIKQQIPILRALAGDIKNLDDSNILVLRGPDAQDKLDELILAEGRPVSGLTYDYHVTACFDYDKNYRLRENNYLQVVNRLGDKFVFPGHQQSIQEARELLKANPFLKGKWQPKWIAANKFKFKVNFYCFADNVAFAVGSYRQKDFLVYVIKNKDITESMRNLVEMIWEQANKI